MKYIIASDLHGSCAQGEKLLEVFEKESADKLLLLGDILYHGPRNPLPVGHGPQELAFLLNGIAEDIVCVRGNCDAEVDQMVLDFSCKADFALIRDGGLTFFLTHGHIPSISPQDARDAYASVMNPECSLKADASQKSDAAVEYHMLSDFEDTNVLLKSTDVYLSGHTHKKVLERMPSGRILLNPGSTSLPKDGSASYAMYDNGVFTLKTFDGVVVSKLSVNSR